jgi:hypothetical protein
MPFARAFAPELAKHGIAKEDFVDFIDNLNIVMTPHVAFRALRIAGFAVGLVPLDVIRLLGSAMALVGTVGSIAMYYTRTRDYLSLMNEKYFHPRKLHIKVISAKRMKKMFKLDKKDPCLAPLTKKTLELTTQERCLQYLSEYISELSFDVPPPTPATTFLARFTELEIRHKVRDADKHALRDRTRAWEMHQKEKAKEDCKEVRSWRQKQRVKSLDWLLVQNLEEWEARKAEKKAKK